MSDLTVPPLPVVTRVTKALRLEWAELKDHPHKLAGAELVSKADAEAAIASLQARLEAAELLLREAAEFWSHYSSLNEGAQDDMADERGDMLERMHAATQEKPAGPRKGSQG